MKDLSIDELFKRLALYLTGYWYEFDGKRKLVFSLLQSRLDTAEVKIIADHGEELHGYQLYYFNGEFIILIIKKDKVIRQNLQMADADTLILTTGTHLQIYVRQKDVSFADQLLLEVLEEPGR